MITMMMIIIMMIIIIIRITDLLTADPLGGSPSVIAPIELEFKSVDFCGKKTFGAGRVPRRKPKPHETATTGIEPESQRWDWGELLSSAPPILYDLQRWDWGELLSSAPPILPTLAKIPERFLLSSC